MSSFYGSYYGSINNASSATSDYNDLSNTPITIVTGTEDNPIILSELTVGNYIIQGYYLYTSLDTEVKNVDSLNVVITQDSSTEELVARIESIENQILYVSLIYFNDTDDSYSIDKIPITGATVLFYLESTLPSSGTENILYVTESAMYRWIDGEYIKYAICECDTTTNNNNDDNDTEETDIAEDWDEIDETNTVDYDTWIEFDDTTTAATYTWGEF